MGDFLFFIYNFFLPIVFLAGGSFLSPLIRPLLSVLISLALSDSFLTLFLFGGFLI